MKSRTIQNLTATRVGLIVTLAMLTACSKAPQPDAENISLEPPVVNSIEGTSWTAVKILNRPADTATSTLTLSTDGRVSGSAGCNNYTGEAELELAAINLGLLATTRMMCAPAVSGQETAFLEALGEAKRWQRMGNTLILMDAAGIHVMELTSQPTAN